MTNPNKHKGSSITNGTDLLATYGCNTVNCDRGGSIRPDEKPSEWAARVAQEADA